MKFTIEKKALVEAANTASGVVERRNTIPILGHVKLSTDEGKVTFTATDLQSEISVTKPVDIEAHGAVTVPADMLKSIAAKLPDGKLVSIYEEDNRVVIKSGRSRFVLNTLDVDDFPSLSTSEFASVQAIDAKKFGRVIERASKSMSNEETRYYLNGVALQYRDGVLKAIATDGHRLIVEQLEGAEVPDIIIPAKAVSEIKSICSDGDIELSVSETKFRIVGDGVVFTSSTIDGTFPDWTRVIPEWSDSVLTANAVDIAAASDRVALVASDRTRAVKLKFQSDGVTLSVQGADGGRAQDFVDGEWSGKDGDTIALNAAYLAHMLALAEKGDVDISKGSDMVGAVRIRFHESPETISVVMSMRH